MHILKYFIENNHDPIIPKYIWSMLHGELRRRAELFLRNTKNLKLECAKCSERYRENDGVWRPFHPKGCSCKRVKAANVEMTIRKAVANIKPETVLIEQTRLHTAIAGIDGMVRISYHQQIMLEESKIAGLEEHIKSFREQRQGLYAEKADMAQREIATYLLLENLKSRVPGRDDEKEERDAYRNGIVRNAFEDLVRTTLGIDITDSPAKSYTSDAIRYMQNQEVHLGRFLDDGNIACNNSKAERKFAFFVTLRNQIKMFGSLKDVECAALLELIEQTAREHIKNTRLYYQFLFDKFVPFVKK